MDDSLLMGGFEGFGDLSGDGQSFIDRDWTPGDSIGERFTVDQLGQGRRTLGTPRIFRRQSTSPRDGGRPQSFAAVRSAEHEAVAAF